MDPSIKYATEVRQIYPLDPCLREAHLRHSGGKISPKKKKTPLKS